MTDYVHITKGCGLPCQLTADAFTFVLCGKPVMSGQGLNEDTWVKFPALGIKCSRASGRSHPSQAGGGLCLGL